MEGLTLSFLMVVIFAQGLVHCKSLEGDAVQISDESHIENEAIIAKDSELSVALDKLKEYEQRLELLETQAREFKKGLPTSVEGTRPHRLSKRAVDYRVIAFSASVSVHTLTGLRSGSTIVYDDTLTNKHDSYDNHTGIFTAPESGIYVFHFNTMIEANTFETIELVRDGHNLASSFIQSMGPMGPLSSASALVTAEVAKGEQVWVRTFTTDQHGTGVIHGNGYSTFSGWIIAYIGA